ncbi:MAG: hypothetical protein SAK29_38185 [Scytonema sp. PMC 1069.18]|nr:hypothetical protein [Scytonema sp. PMC 1069.18]MEC4883717.1 hypothetical protein [Scytonema sp. PMC 1070.18]
MLKNVEQFQEEIKDELLAAVNNSKLIELFQQYDLLGDQIVTFQCVINLDKIPASDKVENQQFKASLKTVAEERIVISSCDCFCTNPPRYCCCS